jgi:hypothetical protein
MENMSDAVVSTPSQIPASPQILTPPAPPVKKPGLASKLPKTKIIVVFGVVLVLFVLFSFHRRIAVVQKRNNEIIKKLKDAEAKHGVKKA